VFALSWGPLSSHQVECLQQAMQIKAKNEPRLSLAEVKRRNAEAKQGGEE
jgi:hypothetical protein